MQNRVNRPYLLQKTYWHLTMCNLVPKVIFLTLSPTQYYACSERNFHHLLPPLDIYHECSWSKRSYINLSYTQHSEVLTLNDIFFSSFQRWQTLSLLDEALVCCLRVSLSTIGHPAILLLQIMISLVLDEFLACQKLFLSLG